MVSISRFDVADIYNTAFAEPARLKEIGGIIVWVHHDPHRIVRFSDMENMEIVWKLEFDFMWDWDDTIYPGKYQSLVCEVEGSGIDAELFVRTGMIRFRKVRGDVDRLLKDFVIMKLYDHEWVHAQV